MDSLEKIIADMEKHIKLFMSEYNSTSRLISTQCQAAAEDLNPYLTRLKALRESNTKTLLDQVREVMAQKDKSHSQITDEIIKVIEDYEKQFT
jgi:hypothetical protein